MAVRFEHDGPIFVIRLFGTVEPADLKTIADEVIAMESRVAEAPPRLADFRDVDDVKIGFVEMFAFAERGTSRPLSNPVRSALIVGQPLQLGFARMFETLNTHPMVTVRIFDDETSARGWLLDR